MCASILRRYSLRAYSGETSSDLVVFSMIEEQHGVAELRLDLLRIEHMKQDHFIAAIAQRLDGLDDDVRVLVEIRHHHHDAAPVQEILEVDERLGEIGVRPDLGLLDGVQQAEKLPLPRGRRDVILHVLIEDDQPGGVALARWPCSTARPRRSARNRAW